MPRTDSPLPAARLIVLAAVCITVAALYFAQAVLVPLALAILVSFLLAPLVWRLERSGVPRVPSVLIVFVCVLAVVAVLGWVVYLQMLDLADRLPQYRDDVTVKVRSLVGSEPGAFKKAADAIGDVGRAVSADEPDPATTQASADKSDPLTLLLRRLPVAPPAGTEEDPLVVRTLPERPSPLERISPYLGNVFGIAFTAGLVLVFVIFILLARENLRDRLIRLVGYGELNITTQALDDATTRISRYLLALSIVNGSYGIAISIGLWIIGQVVAGETFPNFVLWGLLCALLRFIPYVGPWVAASFPIILSFAVFPGYSMFLSVAAMFVIVELLSNNFMEPWLYGASTGMSTIAVIVAAVFWTWLWGPIGLVMATPLTVCLVVMGKYVPQLKFFDIMLGDDPVLSPAERVYQRLLAMDQEEAMDVVEEYGKTQTLDEVFGAVLLPALALAEVDRHAGNLDDARSRFIRASMRQMIEDLGDEDRLDEVRRAASETEQQARGQSASASSQEAPARWRVPADCTVNIVLLPAHDEADEIASLMLAQLLESRGYCAFAASQDALASEMIEQVEVKQAAVVCVSALPPAAVAHARYLCKRLHARFPEVNTVVGLWTATGDLKKARQRLVCAESVQLATTFSQALTQIRELAQSKIITAQRTSDTSLRGAPTP